MMQGVVARLLATRYDPTTRLHASRARLEDAYGRYRRVLLERRNLEAIAASSAGGGGGLLEAAVDRKRADVADALHLLARALAAHRRALVTVGGGAERSAA
jgi:hypothetical protein